MVAAPCALEQKNAVVMYSIIGENCKLAPWARVEGAPLVGDKQSIAILGASCASTEPPFP